MTVSHRHSIGDQGRKHFIGDLPGSQPDSRKGTTASHFNSSLRFVHAVPLIQMLPLRIKQLNRPLSVVKLPHGVAETHGRLTKRNNRSYRDSSLTPSSHSHEISFLDRHRDSFDQFSCSRRLYPGHHGSAGRSNRPARFGKPRYPGPILHLADDLQKRLFHE